MPRLRHKEERIMGAKGKQLSFRDIAVHVPSGVTRHPIAGPEREKEKELMRLMRQESIIRMRLHQLSPEMLAVLN